MEKVYPESLFGGFTAVDGTLAFYLRIQALLPSCREIADVGCGVGEGARDPVEVRRKLRMLRGPSRHVIGLDLDPAGAENPLVDEFRRIEGPRWPLEDGSVDLLLADWVVEHLEEPSHFFAESARVLRPEGFLCLRTPNLWSYFGLCSALIPNRWHKSMRNQVQERPEGKEISAWRTFYRCNTIPALRTALARSGFEGQVLGHNAEPAYLSFSRLAYRMGSFYQRWAPSFLAVTLFVFAQRRPASGPLSPKSS
ncbi:class I SAM-dependent methyltransferase [Methylacidimicrobium sp. B4]|uniref:class I SAM-dependent methyltransferase n=1 Tax=Methylacidimicrobium sp. B4 TaxID=2796139 RepID=UPI001A8C1200|nr:class I SAM-dependent methyltransferase [Methylacidimicrobium sp. B4]QSR85445.1 class I SAM-dependent methyltransferase [Methylacidimicrobium sp. B4]